MKHYRVFTIAICPHYCNVPEALITLGPLVENYGTFNFNISAATSFEEKRRDELNGRTFLKRSNKLNVSKRQPYSR